MSEIVFRNRDQLHEVSGLRWWSRCTHISILHTEFVCVCACATTRTTTIEWRCVPLTNSGNLPIGMANGHTKRSSTDRCAIIYV